MRAAARQVRQVLGGRCGASEAAGAGRPRVRRGPGRPARARGRPSPEPLLWRRKPARRPGVCGRLPGLADLAQRPPLRAVAGGLTAGRARPPARGRGPAEVLSGPATLTLQPQPWIARFTAFQRGHTAAQAGGCPAPARDLLPLP